VDVGTLRLLDSGNGPGGHEGEVFCCAYSPDGVAVLSGGWDGQLRLWNAYNGAPLSGVRVGRKPLSACAFSPDGARWLCGCMDGMLSAWDVTTHQPLFSFLAHTRPISGICFAPDGRQLATAGWDRRVVLRPAGREREGTPLTPHDDVVAGCRFTPDGTRLLSWSYDGTVRLWDLSPEAETVLGRHDTRVTAGAVSPDGRRALTGGLDGSLRLWDLQARAQAGAAQHAVEVRGCFFLPDAGSALTVDAEGWMALLSLPDLQLQAQLDTGAKALCGDLAPSGTQAALGGEDGRVRFVALEGFDGASLFVTATRGLRATSGVLGRLFGKTRLVPTYLFTCPVCRKISERSDAPAGRPFPCPGCRRDLRIGATVAELQEQ
jgi:WD40 repeat protein